MSKSSRPLVSIIMPCYNSEKTLDVAILSLVNQTYPFFEIIAIDDGSEDNTKDILMKWAKKDSRIKPFFLPHKGIVYCLNFGLLVSKGKYIARMDSDDIAHKKRIEIQVEFLEKRPEYALVGTQVSYLGKREGFKRYVMWQNSLSDFLEIKKNQFLENPIAHPTFMFKRSLIDQLGGYIHGPFPEDYEFLLRILSKGFFVSKIPKKLLVWRDLPERVSRKSYRCSKEGFLLVKIWYLVKWILKNQISDVAIFGFGKDAKIAIEMLLELGIKISKIFSWEKKAKEYKNIPVYGFDHLPPAGTTFVLAFIGSIELAQNYEKFLVNKGYKPLKDFLICG